MPNSNRAGGAHHSTHGGDKSGGAVNASQSNMSTLSGAVHAQMTHHDGQGRSHGQVLRSSYNTKESMLSSSGNFPLGMQFGSNNFSASGKFGANQQAVY